jgi:tRNA(fMet)-specific endonuclease VapC
MMYVLDTNTVSYFFRGEGGVADRLLATPPRDIALSAVTSYELRFGVARVPKAKRLATQLETLLAWITILPFDDSVAQVAANIRVELERAGQPIGPLDVLIAATSLAANGVLITRNLTEFRRIPGLNLQNWYE